MLVLQIILIALCVGATKAQASMALEYLALMMLEPMADEIIHFAYKKSSQ